MEDIRKQCIFCRIADHDIPGSIEYEDEQIIAFRDLTPLAPVHVLIIPKKHIQSMASLEAEDEALMGHLMLSISRLAKQLGLEENGYRVVSNCGRDGCQTVPHIHFHLLGGRILGIFVGETEE